MNGMTPKEQQRQRALAMLGIRLETMQRWENQEHDPEARVAAEGEVLLYGPIVVAEEEAFWSWFFGEDHNLVVSNNSFRKEFNQVQGDVTVRIDSPGGDVWSASGIQAAILERGKTGATVSIAVDGLAASAASAIMVAGSSVSLAPLSSVMIHETHGLAYVNKRTGADLVNFLTSFDQELSRLLEKRMGLSLAAINKLLEAETWYTSSEALEAGLGDSVLDLEAGDPAISNDKNAQMLFANRARWFQQAAMNTGAE